MTLIVSTSSKLEMTGQRENIEENIYKSSYKSCEKIFLQQQKCGYMKEAKLGHCTCRQFKFKLLYDTKECLRDGAPQVYKSSLPILH